MSIELGGADLFQAAGARLQWNGTVAVQEEVARPPVPAVEGAGVAGEPRPHAPRQARPGGALLPILENRRFLHGHPAGV